jgi:hypothetical protein
MSFLLYFAMLIAALVSVVMGLEVATTPPPTQTAATPALVEPIRHASPPKPVGQAQPSTAAQAAPPQQTVSQSPADQASAQATAPGPACNVPACEAAYQSFRASDCTYQPFEGPRRLCSK